MTTIYDTRLRGYWNELLVEEELLKLRLFNNNKIDHPSTGSKDLADALAGSVFNCIQNIAFDTEIEIEILTADKAWEFDEDKDDYGTVKVYNKELGQFSDGYSKQTIDYTDNEKWIESI